MIKLNKYKLQIVSALLGATIIGYFLTSSAESPLEVICNIVTYLF